MTWAQVCVIIGGITLPLSYLADTHKVHETLEGWSIAWFVVGLVLLISDYVPNYFAEKSEANKPEAKKEDKNGSES